MAGERGWVGAVLPTKEIRRSVSKLQRRSITLGNISHNDDSWTHRHEDCDHHSNDHEEATEHKRRTRNCQLRTQSANKVVSK